MPKADQLLQKNYSPAVQLHNQRPRSSQELKIRIQPCERQLIQITKEIQDAIRQVTIENTKLRSLLVQQGVTEAEIETFIPGLELLKTETNLPMLQDLLTQ